MRTCCLIVVAASLVGSSHAAIVVHNHEDQASTSTRRSLRGFAADFQMHDEMSCRTSNGDNGSRSTGEFELYENLSRKACKKRCLVSTDTCYGFEYSSSGKCETWKVPIDRSKLKYAPSQKCYIKDETLLPRGYNFRQFGGKGCRTSNGDKGSKSTGEFDLFKKVTRSTCENKCVDEGKGCSGYEYSSRGGKCEIWKVRIDESKLKFMTGGFDCYVKDGSTEGPNTSVDDGNQFNLDARELTGFADSNGHVWKSSRQIWNELTIDNDFKWKESYSDENSVYLLDKNGRDGVTARIDLKLAQIIYCPDVGRCSAMAAIKTVASNQKQHQCSRDKEVRIYKFSINGECDSSGDIPRGEHQLRFDGSKYFPNRNSDCNQSPQGYCKWDEEEAHYLGENAPWKSISALDSITVGTIEHDKIGQDDITSAKLEANDWYIDTCETYEVAVAAEFYQERVKSRCFGLSAALKGKDRANLQDCTNWTEPNDSFVWYLEVKPAAQKRAYRVFSETP